MGGNDPRVMSLQYISNQLFIIKQATNFPAF